MTSVYGNRSTLIQRTLEELKIVAYGQPASSAEFEATDQALDEILAELAARNIASVQAPPSNEPTIPVELVHPLAQVVARHVANKYSLGMEEVNQMFGPEEHPFSPENRCRAIVRSRPHYAPAVPDYY